VLYKFIDMIIIMNIKFNINMNMVINISIRLIGNTVILILSLIV